MHAEATHEMKECAVDSPEPDVTQPPDAVRGELVCWKSSRLGRFAGSREPMTLVSLVDARSGHAFAGFAPNNTAQEHFRILRDYIERWGRPQEIRTGNASPFVGVGRAPKSSDSQASKGKNQIQRALQELDIQWSFVDGSDPDQWLLRFLQEAKQKLVPSLRQVSTPADANRYLEQTYLPRWNARNGVPNTADSHAASPPRRELNSILSLVTLREIDNQNMVRYRLRDYQVSSASGQLPPKGTIIRIESHLDDTVHFRLHEQKIKVRFVEANRIPGARAKQQKPKKDPRRGHNRTWMKEFSNWVAPPLWTHMRSR
jgi:hypothetical protein